MKWVKLLVCLSVSALFAVSATGKLMSIDSFEIYLYRVTLLDYDLATIVARLLIGVEFLIAAIFLVRIRYRLIWWLTLLFLGIFSIFLISQIMKGESENCFCLGELMDLSPKESLLKNGITFLLMLFVYRVNSWSFKGSNIIFILILIPALATPLVVSPPDIFVKGRFNQAQHDQHALEQVVFNDLIPAEYIEGKKVLAFYSTKCRYCQMAAERLGALIEKGEVDADHFRIVFPGDSVKDVSDFFEKTHSPVLQHTFLTSRRFLDITKGRFPLILMIDDAWVEARYSYRTIDEEEIRRFLKEED